jgi:hypothetical protein
MNNAILIQQVYKGLDYEPMLELTKQRNQDYCTAHNFDYECLIGTLSDKYADANKGGWVKIEMIQRALQKGYEYIVWLDADALIKDLDTDLRDACPKGIGACWMRIPQLNHWNVGVLYIQNSQAVKNFVAEWLDTYPGEKQWMEQGEFNKLAMKSKIVQTISDRWNATINYSMVPDAVVLGFHGYGDANQRLGAMNATLEAL